MVSGPSRMSATSAPVTLLLRRREPYRSCSHSSPGAPTSLTLDYAQVKQRRPAAEECSTLTTPTSSEMDLVQYTGTRRFFRHTARSAACLRRTIVELALCVGECREVDGQAPQSRSHAIFSRMVLGLSLLQTKTAPSAWC